ncbi:DNA-directed RNA polymerase [Syncephalis plumigaleata]|nr:DNA-directed RNA polymerase [Syncephalis plumigaleata]
MSDAEMTATEATLAVETNDDVGYPGSDIAGKLEMLAGNGDDLTAATFVIHQEDHTLGNALRYMIMKNPLVEFCGYSLPHPSDDKLHLRIQTFEGTTAVEALEKGLQDLMELCGHIYTEFESKMTEGNYESVYDEEEEKEAADDIVEAVDTKDVMETS